MNMVHKEQDVIKCIFILLIQRYFFHCRRISQENLIFILWWNSICTTVECYRKIIYSCCLYQKTWTLSNSFFLILKSSMIYPTTVVINEVFIILHTQHNKGRDLSEQKMLTETCGDIYCRPYTYCRRRKFMPVHSAHIVALKP